MKYAIVVRRNHPGTNSWFESVYNVPGDTIVDAETLSRKKAEEAEVIQVELVTLTPILRMTKTISVEKISE